MRTDHRHAKAPGVVRVKGKPRHYDRAGFEARHGGIECRIVSRPYVAHMLVAKRADAAIFGNHIAQREVAPIQVTQKTATFYIAIAKSDWWPDSLVCAPLF